MDGDVVSDGGSAAFAICHSFIHHTSLCMYENVCMVPVMVILCYVVVAELSHLHNANLSLLLRGCAKLGGWVPRPTYVQPWDKSDRSLA